MAKVRKDIPASQFFLQLWFPFYLLEAMGSVFILFAHLNSTSVLPKSQALMVDMGVAGPVLPSILRLASFSRRVNGPLPTFPEIFVVIVCSFHYAMASYAFFNTKELLNLNLYKYANLHKTCMVASAFMCIVFVFDMFFTLLFIKKQLEADNKTA